jgi:hypothetical protein
VSELGPLAQLIADGLVRREGQRCRTTARWQAALARAALGLQRAGAPWGGLRLPVAAALAERYPGLGDDALADLVEAMLPVEEAELAAVLPPAAAAGEP